MNVAQAAIMARIGELEDERNAAERRILEIEDQISAVRSMCDHEREDRPEAWWCRWCGGPVPSTEKVS